MPYGNDPMKLNDVAKQVGVPGLAGSGSPAMNQIQAQKAPETMVAFDRLQSNMKELIDIVAALEQRLAPVSRTVPQQTVGGSPEQEFSSQIAQGISQMSVVAAQLHERIHFMIERLEI